MNKIVIPKMHSVKSSNIVAIGYDEAKNELHVTFKGGSHYSYAGVPQDIFNGLKTADSVGSFFHSKIKGNFKHTKLDKKEEHPHKPQ